MAYRERTDPKGVATERFLAATERETRALSEQARREAAVARCEAEIEQARVRVGACVAVLRHLEAVDAARALMVTDDEPELGERMAGIEQELATAFGEHGLAQPAARMTAPKDIERERGRLGADREKAEQEILIGEEALAEARRELATAMRELSQARRERDVARAELSSLSSGD
jgi:hypothetical protein